MFLLHYTHSVILIHYNDVIMSVRGIHRWPVNSSHKRPVTRKLFPFDDVIMKIPALAYIMAQYLLGDKASCEPMMIQFTHVRGTMSKWVNECDVMLSTRRRLAFWERLQLLWNFFGEMFYIIFKCHFPFNVTAIGYSLHDRIEQYFLDLGAFQKRFTVSCLRLCPMDKTRFHYATTDWLIRIWPDKATHYRTMIQNKLFRCHTDMPLSWKKLERPAFMSAAPNTTKTTRHKASNAPAEYRS